MFFLCFFYLHFGAFFITRYSFTIYLLPEKDKASLFSAINVLNWIAATVIYQKRRLAVSYNRRFFQILISAVLPLLFISSAVKADIGALKDVIDIGYSDGWDAKLKSGTYWLENKEQQGAIRYYYTSYKTGDGGSRTISVKVKLQTDDSQARAGMIYGFDKETRSYYLIVLGPDGQLEVVRRDKSGFNLRMSNSTDIDPEDFNKITVREQGNEISLSVNGRNFGGFGNDTVGKNAVGIVAVGTGKFAFTDYLESIGKSDQASPIGKSTTKSKEPQQTAKNKAKNKHVIRDEFGFEQPMEAMTMTLPKGWDVKGAVQWYGKPSCEMEKSIPKIHFMATAPDGKQWVEFIPGGVWGWSTNFDIMPQMAQAGLAGCEVRRITDIKTFVDEYIPVLRPDARIISMRPRPDEAKAALSEIVKEMRKMNTGFRLRPEAMEVQVSYDHNGNTIDELLIPVVLFMDQQAVDFQGGMSAVLTQAIAIGTTATATVNGKADEKLMTLIGESIEANPEYNARLAKHYQDRTRLMAQATQRQLAANRAYRASLRSNSKSVAQINSEILDIGMKGYENRSNIQAAGHAKSVDMMLERKPWQNSSGQTIYMPQQYQRVYQLSNDVYAGSNDAFFNPAAGTQLKSLGY
jgi:hypothetical protein